MKIFIIIGFIYGLLTFNTNLNYKELFNNSFFININLSNSTFLIYYLILHIFIFIYLYLASYYDYKEKEIYDKYTVPILILGLLHIYNIEIMAYIALIMISIRYIGALFFHKEVFGEADIIVYVGLASLFNISEIIGLYLLTCYFGLFYALFQKKILKKKDWETIPMIPIILFSIPFVQFGFIKYILNLF